MTAPDFIDYDESNEAGTPDFFSDFDSAETETPDFFGDFDQPQGQQQQFNQPQLLAGPQQAPQGYQPSPSPMNRTPGQSVVDGVHAPGQVPQGLAKADVGAPDFFSPKQQEPEDTYLQRAKNYFKKIGTAEDPFAQALTMQMKSGGFAGAPSATPKIAKKVATEVATIAAVEALFAPIVGAAAASQYAPKILESVARLTQAGATGSATAATSKLVETGELPTQEELIEHGLEWMAIDAIMQGMHLTAVGGKLTYDFGAAVEKIAKEDKIPRSQVLNKLWQASKNYIKQKYGRTINTPEDIKPADVEILVDKVKLAEKEGIKTAETIEVTPEKVAKPKPLVKEDLSIPENAVLTKPESISIGAHGEKGTASVPVTKIGEGGKEYYAHENIPVTKEEQQLIDASNSWSKAGDQKESSALAQQAREMIYDRLKGKVQPVKESASLPEERLQEVKRQDISRQGLKDQKKYILDEVKNALENPPQGDKVLIDVPGDGKFKINNNPKSLETFGKAVEKKWPIAPLVTKPPTHKVKPPSRLQEALQAKKTTQKPPAQTRPLKPSPIGHKQAVARSKIIDLFKTAFTDPIRLGKFKQRAAGIHKLWPKVTRLLKANDVETAAHEIGHNLHTTLYGGDAKTAKEQFANIEKALRPYLGELQPLAHYKPWGMEGFAEFTRMYVTNPDVAKNLAPNFYAKFEADLEAQYPELKNALLEARDYYDTYLQGTPQSRIRAQTSYSEDKGKLANIIDSVKKNLDLDFLKTQFLDDVYPAKRLVAEAFGIPVSEVENLKDERNLYRSLRVLKGAVGKGDVFVLHETFNTKLEKVNGSLRDILKQLPNEEAYREFNDYLIARRSIEKYSQQVATGIELGDAITVEKELRGKYEKLAHELDKYNDTLLQYARDSGLLSSKQYANIKKNNLMYVPFQRVMEKKAGIASGAGRLQAGKPVKKMKGSTRDIIAPIESVLKNTYSILINSEKNLSAQVLAKIAQMKNMGAYVEAVPTPVALKAKLSRDEIERSVVKHLEETGQGDLLEMSDGKLVLRSDLEDIIPDIILKFGATSYPAGENIVTVYFEGKPKYFEVSPEIHEMWTKGIAPYTTNLLTKILRIPASTLRAGAILNPKFIQKNMIRDTWGGFLFTKYGKKIKDPAGLFIDTLYSPLAMLATSARKGPLYVEWLKSGGGMSTMQSLDRDMVSKKLDEVRRGIKPHQVIKWLRHVAEISEEGNRLAEFDRALKVEGNTRLGKEIAAFAARDLSIDFAKMGLQTKALNQIIPFWNATIQGGDKLIRAMANPKDRKEFIPRVIGFIVIPSLILAWLNHDDENVKEFYEEEKDFNFITKIGDTYVKIPVPFETGVIAHGLTQRMYNYFMKKDPEAFEQFMGSVIEAMLPNLTPSFANPFIETWANKNFFTNARIIPQDKEGLIAKYQYKNNTSTTARLLGRAMTYMLGQDTRSKAASPAVIDHFINSWTGGLGRVMINISDASLEAAGLSDKVSGIGQTITERLGFDAFTARFPRASTRSIEKFYDNYADATARVKSHKYAEKMDHGTEEEREEAYQRIEKIYNYPTLQRAYKAIQSCQKEINNIWNDPSIDSDLKKQMIDDLYMQMIEFARAANEDIREYRLNQ